MTAPSLQRIHHVAYRCRDAKETVEWYGRVLGMAYTTAFAENTVPSTGEDDPYMHVFLDAGGGNVLAFFELPQQPEMGRDPRRGLGRGPGQPRRRPHPQPARSVGRPRPPGPLAATG